ncbi:hypothetical protein BvCmsKKP059_01186 [Escherichia coli]|nr:hypothetical protein BvCmsKKP059_01186 [Escherichia coli]GDS02157.1 hypothetical protein BvCmsSINP036_04855 [Escherichia coli]
MYCLRFQPLAGILRVAIDKLQGVQRNGRTTANQTRDVVHNAPYTVEQNVAHRLYLSVAVLQASRMQTEFTFTDQPATLTVIQRGGAQVSCRFRPHGPAPVIHCSGTDGQFLQAVQRTASVIQRLACGINADAFPLNKTGLIVQRLAVPAEQAVCHHLTGCIVNHACSQGQSISRQKHTGSAVQCAGIQRHRPLTDNPAPVTTVTVTQCVSTEIQRCTALYQAAGIVDDIRRGKGQ